MDLPHMTLTAFPTNTIWLPTTPSHLPHYCPLLLLRGHTIVRYCHPACFHSLLVATPAVNSQCRSCDHYERPHPLLHSHKWTAQNPPQYIPTQNTRSILSTSRHLSFPKVHYSLTEGQE